MRFIYFLEKRITPNGNFAFNFNDIFKTSVDNQFYMYTKYLWNTYPIYVDVINKSIKKLEGMISIVGVESLKKDNDIQPMLELLIELRSNRNI